jgi:transposase
MRNLIAEHMMSDHLFDKSEFLRTDAPQEQPISSGRPRLRHAVRNQQIMHVATLDDLLPADHVARAIWSYVERLDLSMLLAEVKAVEGHVGRAAFDPRILFTLWLYATSQAVGSGRQLAQLCENHLVYKWICGGLSPNHHTLSDFRNQHEAVLDRLLTDSVAVLMHADIVKLERVAQDGVRVRAAAGQNSFRRRPSLEVCREEARQQVETLKAELGDDSTSSRTRTEAARLRAARERQERVEQALAELEKIEAKKRPKDKDKARASTTDAESRCMKMAGGGFRPAYNIQFATDTNTQVVVGVDAVNVGSDKGQLRPMFDQLEQRYEKTPLEMLADGDFTQLDDIEYLEGRGTKVYAPPRKRPNDRPVNTPVVYDTPAIQQWRERMVTPEAKVIYKERAASIECVNAQARNRGLQQLRTRGLLKARITALWFALIHNVMCTRRLLPSYFAN